MKLDKQIVQTYMAQLSLLLSMHCLRTALFFKHEAYENEKEYRFLQLFRGDQLPSGVRRRYRSYEMVQYAEFPWRDLCVGALKRIVVGPSADRPKALRFARECVSAFHTVPVDVIYSEIPYRAV